MKLSTNHTTSSILSTLLAAGLASICQRISQAEALINQSKLLDKCCQVGKERAIESVRFNCKLSANEALVVKSQQSQRSLIETTAIESLLARDPNFADQCEMVLESCCMAHHRNRNCDSGKQFAKSGATCMDVELSKEATIATESFNDCCMSCSLGILAAKNAGGSNERVGGGRYNINGRCKLISPLASSLSGQLYEQTYIECCHENLPRVSGALIVPGTPIDCNLSNSCSQRCLSAGTFDSNSRRMVEKDRCECFTGYKLASDGINCSDIDECKLGSHTCNKQSEICENTRGSFRCLARQAASSSSSYSAYSSSSSSSSSAARSLLTDGLVSDDPKADFVSMRLCPIGMRWNKEENKCQSTDLNQRSASLHSSASLVYKSNQDEE